MHDVEKINTHLSRNGADPLIRITVRRSPKFRDTAPGGIGNELHCPPKLINCYRFELGSPASELVGTKKLTSPTTSRLFLVVKYGWVNV